MIQMLLEQRSQTESAARAILAQAESENRNLTTEENSEFERLTETMSSLRSQIDRNVTFNEDSRAFEAAMAPFTRGNERSDNMAGQWVRTDTMTEAALRSGQRFTEHSTVQSASERSAGADEAALARFNGIGEMIRSLATTGGGSAVIPTQWAGQVIDLARNNSAVMQAGASVIPMDAKQVQIGRLTADPTAAFRTENSAITASDPTFDNVTLTAQTLSAQVIGSMEWFQDSDNGESLVLNALSKAIAQRIDLVGLYGGITAGAGAITLPTPPNPRGILAALNATKPANVLGAAANGTTQTAGSYWGEVLDTIYTVRDSNEEPNALIWNTKLGRQYAKATDTTGQPLQLPSEIADIPRYSSNQIPSYTQGTMASRATDIFAGDFSQLLIGQRLGLTIQVLTERYAENGQLGIVAHWRGDVQPARSSAFAVYKAIQGAA